jgi:hypothetical protein
LTHLTYSELRLQREFFSDPEWNLIVYLLEHPGWNGVKETAKAIGTTDRALRRTQKSPGVRASASKKLFHATGYVIVTRTSAPSGIKLTNDPTEIEEAARLIEHQLWSEKLAGDEWRRNAKHLRQKDEQSQLELTL